MALEGWGCLVSVNDVCHVLLTKVFELMMFAHVSEDDIIILMVRQNPSTMEHIFMA
jgi:hypothetical protein